MMVAVSIIIPVYNSEKYLKECIESLLIQTLTNCEFIFVNDGSQDNSQSLLESYQKNDTRIVLFQQENQGVSAARNKGLSLAKGEFVGFVDADDYVELDFFQMLYKKASLENLDMVCSNFNEEQDGVILTSKAPFQEDVVFEGLFNKNEIIPFMIQNSGLNSCCTKLYSTNLVLEYNIAFPVGVALGEDGLFTFQCFFYAERVLFLNYFGYHYREVAGSATRNTVAKDYFKRSLEVYHFDYTQLVPLTLDKERVEKLKTIKLINIVISYTSIYLKPNKAVSFFARFRYVHSMISHPIVQKGIKKYEKELVTGKTRYQIFLLHCIKYKMTPLLVIAVTYSQIRNKN
jgi:glycosyltransferase involved in cell wall biosynthesis